MNLLFKRVLTLPTTLEPGCIYFETSTGKIIIAPSSSEKEPFGGLQDAEWNEENRTLTLTPAVGEPTTIQIPEAGVTSLGGIKGDIALDTAVPSNHRARPVIEDNTLKIQSFDWSTAINNAKNDANLKVRTITDWNFDPTTIDDGKEGVYYVKGFATATNMPSTVGIPLVGFMLTTSYSIASDIRRILILKTSGSARQSITANNLFTREWYYAKSGATTEESKWSPWIRIANAQELEDKLNIDGTNATEATITQLIQQLTANSSTAVTDTTEFLSQSSSSTPTKWYRRPLSTLWTYIKSKLATVATTGSQWDLNNRSIERVVKTVPNFTTAQWIRVISPTAQFKLENVILNLQTEFVNLVTNSVEVHIRAAYVDTPEVMILRNNATSNVISKLRIGRVNKSSGNAVVDVLIQPNAGEMNLCSVIRILNAYTAGTLPLDISTEPVSADISDEYLLLNEYDLTSPGLNINNTVKANSIVKEGGTSSQILLANGDTRDNTQWPCADYSYDGDVHDIQGGTWVTATSNASNLPFKLLNSTLDYVNILSLQLNSSNPDYNYKTLIGLDRDPNFPSSLFWKYVSTNTGTWNYAVSEQRTKLLGLSTSTDGWYRIAETSAGIHDSFGRFKIIATSLGNHSIIHMVVMNSSATYPYLNIDTTKYEYGMITKVRMVYPSTYTNNKAYIDVYVDGVANGHLYIAGESLYYWKLLYPCNKITDEPTDNVLEVDVTNKGNYITGYSNADGFKKKNCTSSDVLLGDGGSIDIDQIGLYGSSTKSSSFTADPKILYTLTGSSNITVTIPASATATDNFIFQFNRSGTVTFTKQNGTLYYAGGGTSKTFAAGKRYEVNILNNHVLWAEF